MRGPRQFSAPPNSNVAATLRNGSAEEQVEDKTVMTERSLSFTRSVNEMGMLRQNRRVWKFRISALIVMIAAIGLLLLDVAMELELSPNSEMEMTGSVTIVIVSYFVQFLIGGGLLSWSINNGKLFDNERKWFLSGEFCMPAGFAVVFVLLDFFSDCRRVTIMLGVQGCAKMAHFEDAHVLFNPHLTALHIAIATLVIPLQLHYYSAIAIAVASILSYSIATFIVFENKSDADEKILHIFNFCMLLASAVAAVLSLHRDEGVQRLHFREFARQKSNIRKLEAHFTCTKDDNFSLRTDYEVHLNKLNRVVGALTDIQERVASMLIDIELATNVSPSISPNKKSRPLVITQLSLTSSSEGTAMKNTSAILPTGDSSVGVIEEKGNKLLLRYKNKSPRKSNHSLLLKWFWSQLICVRKHSSSSSTTPNNNSNSALKISRSTSFNNNNTNNNAPPQKEREKVNGSRHRISSRASLLCTRSAQSRILERNPVTVHQQRDLLKDELNEIIAEMKDSLSKLSRADVLLSMGNVSQFTSAAMANRDPFFTDWIPSAVAMGGKNNKTVTTPPYFAHAPMAENNPVRPPPITRSQTNPSLSVSLVQESPPIRTSATAKQNELLILSNGNKTESIDSSCAPSLKFCTPTWINGSGQVSNDDDKIASIKSRNPSSATATIYGAVAATLHNHRIGSVADHYLSADCSEYEEDTETNSDEGNAFSSPQALRVSDYNRCLDPLLQQTEGSCNSGSDQEDNDKNKQQEQTLLFPNTVPIYPHNMDLPQLDHRIVQWAQSNVPLNIITSPKKSPFDNNNNNVLLLPSPRNAVGDTSPTALGILRPLYPKICHLVPSVTPSFTFRQALPFDSCWGILAASSSSYCAKQRATSIDTLRRNESEENRFLEACVKPTFIRVDMFQLCSYFKIGQQWSASTLGLCGRTNGHTLFAVGSYMLLPLLGVSDLTSSKSKELCSCLRDISKAYNECPYHNEAHGAEVGHSTFMLSTFLEIWNHFGNLEKLALLFSALCHDVAHTGRNNPFLVASSHDLALIYNDRSPLENMHAAVTFRTMARQENNFLSDISVQDHMKFRKNCIELILQTDMQAHFEEISKFRIRRQAGDFDRNCGDRWLVAKMIVKAADVGHGCKKWPEHRRWSYLVMHEFYSQGDEERELGMEVSPVCDRAKAADLPRSQISFLNFVCRPCYEELEAVDGENSLIQTVCLHEMEENEKKWGIMQDQKETTEEGAAPMINRSVSVNLTNAKGKA